MQKNALILEHWTDEKVTCPQKYLAKESRSPPQGRNRSPCKYSSRGAKIQPRFSHSTDQGKITKQVLPQGNFFVIQKLKARDDECENEQAHHSGGEKGLRQRSGGGDQINVTGRRQILRKGRIIRSSTCGRDRVQQGACRRERIKVTLRRRQGAWPDIRPDQKTISKKKRKKKTRKGTKSSWQRTLLGEVADGKKIAARARLKKKGEPGRLCNGTI